MFYIRKTQEFAIRHVRARLLSGGSRNYSKDYASSDDEKGHKQPKMEKEKTSSQKSSVPNEESASAKLNRLLASMQTADDQINAQRADIIVKPGDASRKKKLLQKQKAESKDIFTAAKRVASMFENDEKQQKLTESELLSRLLGGKPTSATPTAEEKELLSNGSEMSLSELIVGMKIDRRQQPIEPADSRSEFVKRSMAAKGKEQAYNKMREDTGDRRPIQRRRQAEQYTGCVNLFGGERLGIFTDPSVLKDKNDLLPTWSYLHEQALKTQVSHPPLNYFEKVAKWTEQGKVWRFPIDNEQDWLDEKDVDFSEHIFLEQHLENWCPTKGPIRHFMELVCVGLSKNPYITAKEKKEHIMWYKNYFESKKDILNDLMTTGKVEKNCNELKQKQIEA